MSDDARDAFPDMEIQAIPPESIIYADVADEAGLRDLLALCGTGLGTGLAPATTGG
jgi:hypothetical protein